MAVGDRIIAGKTKEIIDAGNGEVLVRSKDDITAGDGFKHDVMEGKAVCSTMTTCNIFTLLEAAGIPTHYLDLVDDRTFRALRVNMIPLELIARRIATGSYRKRNPEVPEGFRFKEVLFEIFEKDDKLSPPEAGDDTMNDPFVVFDFDNGVIRRWKPKRSMAEGFIDERLLAETRFADVTPELTEHLHNLTIRIFLILEKAWAKLGGVLFDFKLEFGFDPKTGMVVLADVIDADSWRLRFGGVETSKENFRNDSKSLPDIKKDYVWIAGMTGQFVS